jgi:hypothetical protein
MTKRSLGQIVGLGILLACASWAQVPAAPPIPAIPPGAFQPDAQRTQHELNDLLRRYPPSLHSVLALDPGLMSNSSYLAPYPALAGFLSVHPEIARNPSFYVGSPETDRPPDSDRSESTVQIAHAWENVLTGGEVASCFILAMSLIAWLLRSLMESRRWARWSQAQTEAHARVMDRLAGNEDLLAYINSPAGSKFLQSSPSMPDAGPRSVTAPLGRILWTVQGGVVLLAVGIGFEIVSRQSTDAAQEPLHVLGVLAMALGAGFLVSAIISFMISRHLGLIENHAA